MAQFLVHIHTSPEKPTKAAQLRQRGLSDYLAERHAVADAADTDFEPPYCEARIGIRGAARRK
jgi:hypothetical protein